MIKSLKNTLKKWRRENGLVQKDAAEKLGVSLRTYQGWETGKGGKNPLELAELERRIKALDRVWLDAIQDVLSEQATVLSSVKDTPKARNLKKVSKQLGSHLDALATPHIAARVEARRK